MTNFLRTRRLELKISLWDIAKQIGIYPQAISFWETGRHLPHVNKYPAIAAAYQLPIETVATQIARMAQDRLRRKAAVA